MMGPSSLGSKRKVGPWQQSIFVLLAGRPLRGAYYCSCLCPFQDFHGLLPSPMLQHDLAWGLASGMPAGNQVLLALATDLQPCSIWGS